MMISSLSPEYRVIAVIESTGLTVRVNSGQVHLKEVPRKFPSARPGCYDLIFMTVKLLYFSLLFQSFSLEV